MSGTNFNPLVQGWGRSDASSPSVFGALPSSISSQAPISGDAVVYHITHYHPTILNSIVLGPHGEQQFRIKTEGTRGHSTVWIDSSQRTVALANWDTAPIIEFPGLLARTAVACWLRISSNRASRCMEVRGVQYMWMPVDQHICLYVAQGKGHAIIARVCRVETGATLEMSRYAIGQGLLNVCVVAATLFLSGKSLE